VTCGTVTSLVLAVGLVGVACLDCRVVRTNIPSSKRLGVDKLPSRSPIFALIVKH
jgi:hypothetical protein